MARRILPTLVVGIGEFGRLAIDHVRRRLGWTENPDPVDLLFGFYRFEADAAPPSGQGPPPETDDADSEVLVGASAIRLPVAGTRAGDTVRDELGPALEALESQRTKYHELTEELRTKAALERRADPLARDLGPGPPELSTPVGNAVRAIVLVAPGRRDDAELARLVAEGLRAEAPLAQTLHVVGILSLCAPQDELPGVFDGLRTLGVLGAGAPPEGARLYDKAYVFFAGNGVETLSEPADRAELAGEWCYAMLHMDAVALRAHGCLDGPVGALGARSLISSTIPVAQRAARELAGELLDAMEPDLPLCDADGYDPEAEQPGDQDFQLELDRLLDDYQAALDRARESTRRKVKALLRDAQVGQLVNYVHFLRTMRNRELWADQVRSIHAMVHCDLLERCRRQALGILEAECDALRDWMTRRLRQVLYGWLTPRGDEAAAEPSAAFVLNGLSHAYHWVQSIVRQHDEQKLAPADDEGAGPADVSFDEAVDDLERAVRDRPYMAGLVARLNLLALLLLYAGAPVAWGLLRSSHRGWGVGVVAGMVALPFLAWLVYGFLPDWRARGCLEECLRQIRAEFESARDRVVEDISGAVAERAAGWVRRELIDSDSAPMRRYARKLRATRKRLRASPVFEPRPVKILRCTPQAIAFYAARVLERAREAMLDWARQHVAPAFAEKPLGELMGMDLAGEVYAAAQARCLAMARQEPELAAVEDWFAGLTDADRQRHVRWLRDGAAPYVDTIRDDHGALALFLACTGEHDAFAADRALRRDVRQVTPVAGSGSATLVQVREGFDLRNTRAYDAAHGPEHAAPAGDD